MIYCSILFVDTIHWTYYRVGDAFNDLSAVSINRLSTDQRLTLTMTRCSTLIDLRADYTKGRQFIGCNYCEEISARYCAVNERRDVIHKHTTLA